MSLEGEGPILDENPDSLLENRELIFGPAADRLGDSSGSASPLQPDQTGKARAEINHEFRTSEAKTSPTAIDE